MSKVEQPESWRIRRQSLKHRWRIPFVFVEWLCEWVSYFLGNWAFLQILEYLGRLSIVIAVIFFFLGHGDRQKTKHYQAWQVINLAQGKPGEGGRTAALQDLNNDGVSLANIDLSNATIPGVSLKKADLVSANLSGANLLDANFSGADLLGANLSGAILQGANLSGADLFDANLSGANLYEANLSGATLGYANLSGAELFDANLPGAYLADANLSGADLGKSDINGIINWDMIIDMNGANIYGVKNAPDGFIEWATEHGALSIENRSEWEKIRNKYKRK